VSDYERIGRDTLAVMLDPETSAEDLELAVAIAPWVELREAFRRLRLERGADQARLDQLSQQLRELERRYPGIGDD
jgi:chromosome segregation ATPase